MVENQQQNPPVVFKNTDSVWLNLTLQFKGTEKAQDLNLRIDQDLELLTTRWKGFSTKGSFRKSLNR